MYVCVYMQSAGMETDDLQAQLSHLQQLIVDEEQKRNRQKVLTDKYYIWNIAGLFGKLYC